MTGIALRAPLRGSPPAARRVALRVRVVRNGEEKYPSLAVATSRGLICYHRQSDREFTFDWREVIAAAAEAAGCAPLAFLDWLRGEVNRGQSAPSPETANHADRDGCSSAAA